MTILTSPSNRDTVPQPNLFKFIIFKYRYFFSSYTIRPFLVLQQHRRSIMAPSALGIGIPATSSLTPVELQPGLQKALNIMESDMAASPYDWEMFYFTPDMPFDLCIAKLRQKKWNVVMVGSKSPYIRNVGREKAVSQVLRADLYDKLVGLRKLDPLTPFFERIVNAVHTELPDAKFAFNTSIENTQEAVTRALTLDR